MAKVAQPLISVIVPTVGRVDLLVECVRSIRNQRYSYYEILVIDQDPSQALLEILRETFGSHSTLRYYYAHRAGLNGARNFGLEQARGEIVAFLDDDAVAEPTWLDAIARAFSRTPRPGLIAGKILPMWMKEPPEWYPEERRFLLGLYDIGDEPRPLPETDQPIGANMAGLRSLILAMGGFDPDMDFNYFRKRRRMISGGDTLLALTVRRAGHSIFYEPGAVVRHRVPASKLTRRYFLRRHFWEGVTTIELMKLLGDLPLARRSILRFHTKILFMSLARFVLPNYKGTYPYPKPEIRMLALSRVAQSSGIVFATLTARKLGR